MPCLLSTRVMPASARQVMPHAGSRTRGRWPRRGGRRRARRVGSRRRRPIAVTRVWVEIDLCGSNSSGVVGRRSPLLGPGSAGSSPSAGARPCVVPARRSCARVSRVDRVACRVGAIDHWSVLTASARPRRASSVCRRVEILAASSGRHSSCRRNWRPRSRAGSPVPKPGPRSLASSAAVCVGERCREPLSSPWSLSSSAAPFATICCASVSAAADVVVPGLRGAVLEAVHGHHRQVRCDLSGAAEAGPGRASAPKTAIANAAVAHAPRRAGGRWGRRMTGPVLRVAGREYEHGDMSDRVSIVIEGGVADVRLNRPDKLNAVDAAMFSGLVEAGESLKADPTVRVVVLSGEGPWLLLRPRLRQLPGHGYRGFRCLAR